MELKYIGENFPINFYINDIGNIKNFAKLFCFVIQ